MKTEKKHKSHTARNIVLLILLALVCVGGAELLAMRHFSPALYQRVTAPVRAGINAVGGAARHVLDQAAGLFTPEEVPTEPEPPAQPSVPPSVQPEKQLVSQPKVVDTVPVTDPAITELIQRDDLEILTGGQVEIVYYNQTDEVWANQPYGRDHIGGYGCGPTVMSIAVSSLTDQLVDPAAMAQWTYQNGHCAAGNGSYYTIVEGTAEAYGLQAQTFSGRTPAELRGALLSGQLLVALMGPGHFTQGGHFILLRGATLTGEILVADPSSRERSLTAWDPQLILDELSAGTGDGAPLWVIGKQVY